MDKKTEFFVNTLSHDELMALDACLSIFFNKELSKREAYVDSLQNFPNTKEELLQKLDILFTLRRSDFLNNISNFNGIRC
ncbi:hypothetical protein ID741_002032 [Enterococcus sp. AZ103]